MNSLHHLPPARPNPQDALTRQLCGFGDQSLFDANGLPNESLAARYPLLAAERFERSDEGRHAIGKQHAAWQVSHFLDVLLHSRGETIELLSDYGAEELMLEVLPETLSAENREVFQLPKVVAAFFRFLSRHYDLPQGDRIADRIMSVADDFVDAMHRRGGDSIPMPDRSGETSRCEEELANKRIDVPNHSTHQRPPVLQTERPQQSPATAPGTI